MVKITIETETQTETHEFEKVDYVDIGKEGIYCRHITLINNELTTSKAVKVGG